MYYKQIAEATRRERSGTGARRSRKEFALLIAAAVAHLLCIAEFIFLVSLCFVLESRFPVSLARWFLS